FARLLKRIVAQPAGAPRGRGSYEHCLTLHHLARCLEADGQPGAAVERLREALALIEALLAGQPEHQVLIHQPGALLTDLGDALTNQGNYAEAREKYEDGLKVAEQQGDTRTQGVLLIKLGTLALQQQRGYAEAEERYRAALALFRTLGEPASEAAAWHGLG